MLTSLNDLLILELDVLHVNYAFKVFMWNLSKSYIIFIIK